MTSTPSTTELDTELSAVNSILGSIGQSPITTLDFDNPEVYFVFNLLKECNIDVQSEGWSFNIEKHVVTKPDSNKNILIGDDILQMDINDEDKNRFTDVVKRNGKLYDKLAHTYEFENDVYLDITYLYAFGDIPQVFRRYITYAASTRAATQLVGNPQLAQLLQQKEVLARATCMEYECNQGDPSYFGWPHESSYTPFAPYRALRR